MSKKIVVNHAAHSDESVGEELSAMVLQETGRNPKAAVIERDPVTGKRTRTTVILDSAADNNGHSNAAAKINASPNNTKAFKFPVVSSCDFELGTAGAGMNSTLWNTGVAPSNISDWRACDASNPSSSLDTSPLSGSLSAVDDFSQGQFSWSLASLDLAYTEDYQVKFKARYGEDGSNSSGSVRSSLKLGQNASIVIYKSGADLYYSFSDQTIPFNETAKIFDGGVTNASVFDITIKALGNVCILEASKDGGAVVTKVLQGGDAFGLDFNIDFRPGFSGNDYGSVTVDDVEMRVNSGNIA